MIGLCTPGFRGNLSLLGDHARLGFEVTLHGLDRFRTVTVDVIRRVGAHRG